MVSFRRGDIWWADLPIPRGSEPGFYRPVLIIQDDWLNESGISTVLTAIITSNLALARLRTNVLLLAKSTGMPHDSVVNLSQLFTVDKAYFIELISTVPPAVQEKVDKGLRQILGLDYLEIPR